MPIILKTENKETHLCATCKWGRVSHMTQGRVITACTWSMSDVPGGMRMPGLVEKCTKYHDTRMIDKWEFEQIAWQLTTDPKGQAIGFNPPKNKN